MESSAPDVDSHEAGRVRHIAIIMDGNNRWARQRDLPGEEGHRAGERTVDRVIRHAVERQIEVVTVFAFSSENWRRPPAEVEHLMGLFLRALDVRVPELHENGVRVRFIGDRAGLEPELQQGMARAETLTADNSRLTLVVAVNYGGQWDIARAARALAERVERGEMRVDDINAATLAPLLSMSDLPAPDLLVRTGGEHRISNFLLWQAAYTELYFSPVLWPDFDEREFDRALDDFARRQRRFGRSGEEIGSGTGDGSC